MVWMKPVHFSFLDGLDATGPFFFSPWSGCNQSIFLFVLHMVSGWFILAYSVLRMPVVWYILAISVNTITSD